MLYTWPILTANNIWKYFLKLKLQFSRHQSYFRKDFQVLLVFNKGEIWFPHHALGHTKQHQCKQMSGIMRKPTFCIWENKDADQLCGYREADQRLCFRYIDSTIRLLSKSEISSLYPSSVAVQPGLCWTRSETRMLVFSSRSSNDLKNQGCSTPGTHRVPCR